MTQMEIRATETGVTRLFHLDLPPEAVERFITEAGTGEWPLSYALGAKRLRPSFVDTVAIRDLGTRSLSQYLAAAHDVTGPDFEAMRPRIDALKGHVVILPSQAFGQTAQTLAIAAPLRWVGTFAEATPETEPKPIRSRSTRGTTRDIEGDEDPLAKGSSPALRAILIVALAIIAGVLFYALFG